MNAMGTRAELRAAVTRGFFEQQRAKTAPGASQMILPRQLAPMPKGRLAAVLSCEIDEPMTNAARSATLAGLGHRRTHDLLPAVLGERFVALSVDIGSDKRCPCCAARRALPGPEGQAVSHIAEHNTTVEFDPDDLLTTVTTMVRVRAEWVDWDAFVNSCNPENWKLADQYFRQSDPIEGTRERRTDGKDGWMGRLHENFEWNWNADSEAMFDNDLSIDFSYGLDNGAKVLSCQYDLYRCNASKVWAARESGGLDVDSGLTKATLTRQWFEVTASKRIRFTDPELGPPGLGAMLNYLAPTVAGLWMHVAVQTGVEKSILPAARPSPPKQARRQEARPSPAPRARV